VTTKTKKRTNGYNSNKFVCTEAATKRFLRDVRPEDMANNRTGCWIWQGWLDTQGYGRLTLEWHKTNPYNPESKSSYTRKCGAHRYSWLYHSGEQAIPPGKLVLHICGVKNCVAPHHLKLGNHRTNMNDMKFHGTPHLGSNHGRTNLTEQDVYEIRVAYHAGGVTQKELAAQYGCHAAAVSFMVRGETWKHCGGPRTCNKTRIADPKKRMFSPAQIRTIRKRYHAGETSTDLSAEYGCSHQSIISIAAMRIYKDVT